MSSAQIVVHDKEKNLEYKSNSENISERCKSILRVLDTKLVTKNNTKVFEIVSLISPPYKTYAEIHKIS